MKICKLLCLVLVCALVLSGCGKNSPSTRPDASLEPSSGTASESAQPTASTSPEPYSESPSATPEVPSPTPENVKVWDNNSGISLSVTAWSQEYSAEGSLCLTADISLPALNGAPGAVTDYYTQILGSFQRRAEALSAEIAQWQKDGSLTRAGELGQTFMVECNSGGFISVRRLETYDSGGLRPEVTLMCDNFRVSDGKLLGLDDFFTVGRDEYFPILLTETLRQLEAREDDLAEGWRVDAEALFPFDLFCMTPAGLSLFYPEPSLAAFAIGTVRVDIPWESIEAIWKLP